MLEITIPAVEGYDEDENRFYNIRDKTVLQLEHSLLSIHKWEQKWKVPFLDERHKKTIEETKHYIQCMTINRNVDPIIYDYIPGDCLKQIHDYIEDPMTATKITDRSSAPTHTKSGTVHTAETIYADMIQLNIPVEFRKWHLNALLTLIKVCDLRQSPPKKMSAQETASYYAKLNRMHKPKGK